MKFTSLLLSALFLFLLPSVCPAATDAADAPPTARGLTPVDWVIVALYGASTIALGLYYSRKQENTEEYFVGSGHMNPLLIGVSLFATLLSTISYLSFPGEALGKGPVYLTQLIAFPLIFYVVGYILLPVYMRQRVTSAYELLEANLGLSIRLLGAGLFIVLRLVWMSLLVYLTAKAISVMLGIGEEWIPLIVLATGFVAVIYTSLGGLQVVVITDAMQCALLYGGALLVLVTVTYDYGGFGWFPTGWHANWDTQPILPADPSTRVTMIGSILSVTFWYIATSGGDQTSVQRFMATTDAKAARRAFATQLIVAVIVLVTLGLVGVALLGYFEANPSQLPPGMSLKDNADEIFPRFIAFHLPPGISGLVVAAMFAAAMSSIDSGVNSITAVVMTDLMDRFGRRPDTEKKHVLWARCLAFGIGAAVVIGSSFMDRIPGNITAVTNKTANLLTTPIFCLFFFALFVPFAKPAGVWVGAICGTTTAVLIAFSGPIFGVHPETGLDPISFQWIAPAAVLVNISTGAIVSWMLPSRSNDEPTV
ncbi:sodium-coupled permease [Maioricimonas sp. JC845]|uniref:sodium:solute symporter family transporter n=1 Tax=Maioricimonas sp. JC845 TaxID=3232138 RepID=UPI003459B6FE